MGFGFLITARVESHALPRAAPSGAERQRARFRARRRLQSAAPGRTQSQFNILLLPAGGPSAPPRPAWSAAARIAAALLLFIIVAGVRTVAVPVPVPVPVPPAEGSTPVLAAACRGRREKAQCQPRGRKGWRNPGGEPSAEKRKE